MYPGVKRSKAKKESGRKQGTGSFNPRRLVYGGDRVGSHPTPSPAGDQLANRLEKSERERREMLRAEQKDASPKPLFLSFSHIVVGDKVR